MKKIISSFLAIALLVSCVMLSACQTENGTSPSVSMPTPGVTEPTVYVPPAETPATWSEFDVDATWAETDPLIHLSSENTQTQWKGAKLYGSDLYIKEPGTYILSGTLKGQLYIAVNKEDKVHLVFNGFHVSYDKLSPILCDRADKVVITLVDGTENTVEDTATGYLEGTTSADGRHAGAIHAKMGLTINGTGTLKIKTTYRHGIVSNSNLRIVSGTISVEAEEEGLKGKESVSIRGGNITVRSGDDGIKVNDDQKQDAGFFAMEGGIVAIQTDADGIDVAKNVRIVGGNLNIRSKDHAIATEGIFSTAASPVITLEAYSGAEDSDAKAIKAGGEVTLDGGAISIPRAFEGIESKTSVVRIKSGTLSVTAFNDGINAATELVVEGGSVYVASQGDCLDSGGNIYIKGGTVVLCGSPSNAFAPMDVPEGFEILVDGGVLLAYGSLAEVQYPSHSSSQVFFGTTVSLDKDKGYALRDADGNLICAFRPQENALTLCFSSDALQKGQMYGLYTGAQLIGDAVDGFYSKAVGGKLLQEITVS